MADEIFLTDLRNKIKGVLGFNLEQLLTKPVWGEINFEAARPDFEAILEMAKDLGDLPLELLPNDIAQNLGQQFQFILTQFQEINQYRIANPNPTDRRNTLITSVRNASTNLLRTTAPWIPFLAYRRAGGLKSIQDLSSRAEEAGALVKEAQQKVVACEREVGEIISRTNQAAAEVSKEVEKHVSGRKESIEKIIEAARIAAASAGAVAFTKDFDEESRKFDHDAKRWLIAAGLLALVTLGAAGAMWELTEPGLDNGQLFQKVSSRLVILAVLLSATIWCGRNYKTLKHLKIINRHRALSLLTLQAFSASAADTQTKDAILLEATKAVFGNVPTGYIDGGDGDSDLKIVEVARSILPKSDK